MKTQFLVLFSFFVFGCLFGPCVGECDETNITSIPVEQKPIEVTSAYGQLFTIQIASFKPESLLLDNGSYTFNYGNSEAGVMNSFLAEFGWAPRLLEWHGAFYLEENLAFSVFRGGAAQDSDLPPLKGTSYSLFLFGFDTRIMYAGTWFPWRHWIPFVDGGYQYSIFYQPGSSGFESAQGGVGNAVAALGVRFWLNKGDSLAGGVPFFLTAKLNHIFSHTGDVNLGSTSLFGGVSLGF